MFIVLTIVISWLNYWCRQRGWKIFWSSPIIERPILLYRNIYQHQKLLSIGIEDAIPVLNHREDPLKHGVRELPIMPLDSSFNGFSDGTEASTVLPVLVFLSTVLVIGFLCNHFYKLKSKPKRRRPRIRRFPHVYGKGPGV